MKSISCGAVAFVLLMPTIADASEATELVRSFYFDNMGHEADPSTRKFFTEPASSQFAGNDKVADTGDMGCIDFGLAIDAQDLDEQEITNSLELSEQNNGDTAVVTAKFTNFSTPTEVAWSLKNIGGKWLISDIAGVTNNWRLSEFDCN